MVKRKLPGGQNGCAILAGVAIPQKDVFARQSAALVRNPAVFQQANYGRHTHGDTGGVKKVSIFFLRHRHAFQHEHQSPASGTNVDRLIRSVQYEHRRMQCVTVAVTMRSLRREQSGGVPAETLVGFASG
jgi:hypothetical protein